MTESAYGPRTPCSQCGEEIGIYAPDGTEYCGHCTDDERPNDGVKEGVCCLECHSVIFNVGKLLRHVENRNHYWFKSGDDLAFHAKTLTADDRVFEE
jgi:hypothetical protein